MGFIKRFIGLILGFIGLITGFIRLIIGFIWLIIGFIGLIIGFIGLIIGLIALIIGFIGLIIGSDFSGVQDCTISGYRISVLQPFLLSGTRHPIKYWRGRGAEPTHAPTPC